MPLKAYVIICGFFLITTGCQSTDNNRTVNSAPAPASNPVTTTSPGAPSPTALATSPVKAKIDVCALLTSDDLKSVQGEAPKEAQRSDRRDGAFVVAQCYYALPTTSNSVVLNVTSEGDGANTPRKFWEDTFGAEEAKGGGREKEREREEAKKKTKPAVGEEEGEGAHPEKVSGLGEDAFWMASRVGGALYVLKKDMFFRISVGGAGDEKAKLKKSKTLAQQVLKRI